MKPYTLIIFTFCFISVSEASNCGYQTKLMQERETKCNQTPGMQWVCDLNLCEYQEEAKELQNKLKICQAKSTAPETKQCQDQLALEIIKEDGITLGEDEHSLEIAAKGALAAQAVHIVSSFVATKESKGAGFNCLAKKIYAGAAAGSLISELTNAEKFKGKADEIKQTYQQESLADTSYDQQLKSFEYLAALKENEAEVASAKKSHYMAQMLTYGAASAAAAYELTQPIDACAHELKKTTHVIPLSLFSQAYAQAEMLSMLGGGAGMQLAPLMLALGTAGTDPEVDAQVERTKSFFRSSKGILALSATSMSLVSYLAFHFRKVEKRARSQARHISAIAAELSSVISTDCFNGREDPSVPACYCFLPNLNPHPTRSSNPVCTEFSTRFQGSSKITTGGNNAICVSKDGQLDNTCQCIKTNQCFTPITISNSIPGALAPLTQAVAFTSKFAAELARGRDLTEKIDPTSLKEQALAITKQVKRPPPNPDLFKSNLAPLMNKGQAQATPPKISDDFKRILDYKYTARSGKPALTQGGESDSFLFGLTDLKPKTHHQTSGKVQNYSEKIGDADIHRKNPNQTNLFKILEGAYQKGGKRLNP